MLLRTRLCIDVLSSVMWRLSRHDVGRLKKKILTRSHAPAYSPARFDRSRGAVTIGERLLLQDRGRSRPIFCATAAPYGFRQMGSTGVGPKASEPVPVSASEESQMLVLSRKLGEEIVLDGDIRVKVVEVRGNRVRLAVCAPADVAIRRSELPDFTSRAESDEEEYSTLLVSH
jgi:carbon storage regulator CsrA